MNILSSNVTGLNSKGRSKLLEELQSNNAETVSTCLFLQEVWCWNFCRWIFI